MPETFCIGKLGEDHTKELIEAGKRFHMIIVAPPIKHWHMARKAINGENANCPKYTAYIVQMISRNHGQKPICMSIIEFVIQTACRSNRLNPLNAISYGQDLHLAI